MSDEEKKYRSKLIEQRRTEKIPHLSYDLDGDGIVGNRDYVIAKHFDKDQDGILNEQERKNALEAVKNVNYTNSLRKSYRLILRAILCGMWRFQGGLGLIVYCRKEE